MARASTLKAQSFVKHQVAVIKHKVPVSPSISPKHTGLRQKQTSHASLPFSTLLLSPGICFVFVVAINSRLLTTDQFQAWTCLHWRGSEGLQGKHEDVLGHAAPPSPTPVWAILWPGILADRNDSSLKLHDASQGIFWTLVLRTCPQKGVKGRLMEEGLQRFRERTVTASRCELTVDRARVPWIVPIQVPHRLCHQMCHQMKLEVMKGTVKGCWWGWEGQRVGVATSQNALCKL